MSERSMRPQYFYPNNLGRIVLQAMEEILGHTGINATLNLANLTHLINNYPPDNLDRQFPFEHLSKIVATLENLYGVRGGRGLALRSGRAWFKYELHLYGPELGLTNLSFRLLPLNEKVRLGTQLFAEAFNLFSDQKVRQEEKENNYLWHIERCPVCWQRQADEPVCYLIVGLLQEALYWISSGKYFLIEETHCCALGDAHCTIAIEKTPID